jgi:hypothetical protein
MFNLHLIIQPLITFLVTSPFKVATSKLPLPSSSSHSHSHRHGSIMASKLFLRDATQRNPLSSFIITRAESKAKCSFRLFKLGEVYPYCCPHVVVATYIDRSN